MKILLLIIFVLFSYIVTADYEDFEPIHMRYGQTGYAWEDFSSYTLNRSEESDVPDKADPSDYGGWFDRPVAPATIHYNKTPSQGKPGVWIFHGSNVGGVSFVTGSTGTDLILGFNFYDYNSNNNNGWAVLTNRSGWDYLFTKYNDDNDEYHENCDGVVTGICPSSVGEHRGWIWYNSTDSKMYFKCDTTPPISQSCNWGNLFEKNVDIRFYNQYYPSLWWNITIHNYTKYGLFTPPFSVEEPADTSAPLISEPFCTSCVGGTNQTSDPTPTINVTCTDATACSLVRVGNDSSMSYDTATSSRNCTAGNGDTWICTLPSSDNFTTLGTTYPVYFWGIDSLNNNHSAWNLTINITYQADVSNLTHWRDAQGNTNAWITNEGHLWVDYLVLGDNGDTSLTSGDLRADTIYYETLTAESPHFFNNPDDEYSIFCYWGKYGTTRKLIGMYDEITTWGEIKTHKIVEHPECLQRRHMK